MFYKNHLERNCTDQGLLIVKFVHATRHNRRFMIAQSRSSFVIETINKTGLTARKQVRELWDGLYDSVEEAERAIEWWDRQ